MLDELGLAYPEVPGLAVAEALNGAYVAASVLGFGAGSTRRLVAGVLARDHLDAEREHAAALARRADRLHPAYPPS